MSAADGGPAFPQHDFDNHNRMMVSDPGMTLRDYFAIKALAAMIANTDKDGCSRGLAGLAIFPRYAYEWAEAMLAERAK